MSFDLGAALEEKLTPVIGTERAAELSARIVDEFRRRVMGADSMFEEHGWIAVELVDCARAALVGRPIFSFENAANLPLPDRPPEKWMERDRSKREMPHDFLRRVWGKYIDAGVLYLPDLDRLGEHSLVNAVRVHCHYHGMDALALLPPPGYMKLDLEVESLPEGEAKRLVKARVASRRNPGRHRPRKPKPNP